jgi:hypothetical protein
VPGKESLSGGLTFGVGRTLQVDAVFCDMPSLLADRNPFQQFRQAARSKQRPARQRLFDLVFDHRQQRPDAVMVIFPDNVVAACRRFP